MEAGGPPAWLTGQFPEHKEWVSWRTCTLRIDGKMGSGAKRAILSGSGMYRCEAAESGGWKVVTVTGSPPQKSDLYEGSLIVGIGSYPLFGLEGQKLEQAFVGNLIDGGEVQILDAKELKEAEIERDGEEADECKGVLKEEVSGDGRLIVLPLGDMAVRSLPSETRADLEGDLRELGTENGVVIEVSCQETTRVDTVSIRGEPEKVRAARKDLQEVLKFYKFSVPEPQ